MHIYIYIYIREFPKIKGACTYSSQINTGANLKLQTAAIFTPPCQLSTCCASRQCTSPEASINVRVRQGRFQNPWFVGSLCFFLVAFWAPQKDSISSQGLLHNPYNPGVETAALSFMSCALQSSRACCRRRRGAPDLLDGHLHLCHRLKQDSCIRCAGQSQSTACLPRIAAAAKQYQLSLGGSDTIARPSELPMCLSEM